VQGKQRHPAFVVVRSPVLTTVSVKAQELAEAMAAMQQQVRARHAAQRQPVGNSSQLLRLLSTPNEL
jgi:hypothetical protein